jgi:hypothetical protein
MMVVVAVLGEEMAELVLPHSMRDVVSGCFCRKETYVHTQQCDLKRKETSRLVI